MVRNVKQNIIIGLALFAVISMSNQRLHAEWTASNYAELATSGLRGICTSIEHGLQKNNTTSGHLQRTLISALRVVHGVLVVHNHPLDYHANLIGTQSSANAYLDGSLPSDAINGIANLMALADSVMQCDPKDLSTLDASVSQSLDFMQQILLPVIESAAALFIAISDDISPQNQSKRFIAQKILTLSNLCHDFLNQDKGTSKYATGVVILVHLVHAGYQLTNHDSGFNSWLKQSNANKAT